MKAAILSLVRMAATIVAVTVAQGVLSNTAQAADVPGRTYEAPAPLAERFYNWSGFYAGANAGFGFGNSDWGLGALSNSPSGFLGGGQLGVNYQIGSFVVGVEGDFDLTGIKADTACAGGRCSTSNNWLATARGRIGYAFDRFLPYFTGGGAFGNVKADNSQFSGSSSSRGGYALGGGLEYAFANDWSLRAEYLYVNLGSFNCPSCGFVSDNVSFKANLARAGINFRF